MHPTEPPRPAGMPLNWGQNALIEYIKIQDWFSVLDWKETAKMDTTQSKQTVC